MLMVQLQPARLACLPSLLLRLSMGAEDRAARNERVFIEGDQYLTKDVLYHADSSERKGT